MIHKTKLKNPLYLIAISAFFAIILAILLYGTLKLEEDVESKIIKISTSDVLKIAANNAQYITSFLDKDKSYIEQIKSDKKLQEKIDNALKILLTKNVKYAYIVYKDKNGTFRFISDGSSPQEKAMIGQKFDVTSPLWKDLYKTKKPVIIHHEFLKELFITYLYPFCQNKEVEMILAIDFSIGKIEDVNTIISTMKTTIIATIVIIFLFLTVLAIQTFRFIVARNSAFLDKLTNVYNRNYLQEIENFINLDNYALAALDIDHFKRFNDTYGHEVGDRILKEIAQIILKNCRKEEDIVIRYGGEEFVILVKSKRDERKTSIDTCKRIHSSIQSHQFYISDTEYVNITVSMGVNLTPGQSRTFSDAFKLADIALYNAKNKGRNSIEIYEDGSKARQSGHLSISEINAALEEDRVICYFQPIVHSKTNTVSHYEALLRIVDYDGKIITPDKILPAIKGTFILRNITKRVLKICYKTLKDNPDIQITVNINPQDIINDTIIDRLQMYAKKRDIAQRIGLEIVESEDLIRLRHADKNLLKLKKMGYKIFIDDFGTGYSNFIYLAQIKTDFIKIDGNIIKNIPNDKLSLAIVKSIVNFAKEANIKVVAEHVSNEEIYQIIKSLGIEYAQGYHFSAPRESIERLES